jgi:hypothetical protein
MNSLSKFLRIPTVFIATLGICPGVAASLIVTSNALTIFNLEKPTGKFDEPSLSGFEYLVSDRTGEFRQNDQYLVAGEESLPATTLATDLGGLADLSGTALDFSIRYNLVGGRNFTFSIDDPLSGAASILCWGGNCPAGSMSAETIGGLAPVTQFNGLQIQVRAQEVAASSVSISNLVFTGLPIAPGSDALFDGTVTPATASTIPGDPPGRIIQWLLGDSLDLVMNEWELSGTVAIARIEAIEDLTKVRLAVDLVNDLRLPLPPEEPIETPLPATLWLFSIAFAGLMTFMSRK